MIDVIEDEPPVDGSTPPPQGQPIPWSNECEQGLLGGVLHDNGAYARVSDLVSEASFFQYSHRLIFQTMGALLSQGSAVDVNLLAAALRAREPEDESGAARPTSRRWPAAWHLPPRPASTPR